MGTIPINVTSTSNPREVSRNNDIPPLKLGSTSKMADDNQNREEGEEMEYLTEEQFRKMYHKLFEMRSMMSIGKSNYPRF